jgi:hypothetical protein
MTQHLVPYYDHPLPLQMPDSVIMAAQWYGIESLLGLEVVYLLHLNTGCQFEQSPAHSVVPTLY